MNKITELKQKYGADFSKEDYKHILKNAKWGESTVDDYFLAKYKDRIGKGWYGFSLGPIPEVWKQIIDEYLEYLIEKFSDLTINQIKIKFGGLRFYVNENFHHAETWKEIEELEEWLHHKDLIY